MQLLSEENSVIDWFNKTRLWT